MVTLVKLPGSNGCYGDKAVDPRLLVRPFADPPSGQPSWDADSQTLKQSIIAFLAPNTNVEFVSQALDAQHKIDLTAPPNSAAKRLIFFSAGTLEIGFVNADRLGNINLRSGSFGIIRIGSDFRIAFLPGVLSFSGTSVRISNEDEAAATFAQNDATSQSVVVNSIDIDLLDGAGLQGVLRFDGLAARFDDGQPPTSRLSVYTSLRLGARVNRVMGSGATEVVKSVSSSLIHAGDDFRAIGSLQGRLDPFNHYNPERCFIRLLPVGANADATLTLANGTSLGHDVRVRPLVGDWTTESVPKFIFTRHPQDGSGLASGLHDDTLTLEGDYEVLVPATEAGGDPSPATVGIMPGFSASEALLPSEPATEAVGPLIVSFRAGPAVDPTPRDTNGAPKKGTTKDGPLLGRGKDSPAAHEGVTTWMKFHRGDGRMLLSAEPPDGRRLSETAAAGVFEHRPILRSSSPLESGDGLDGFLPVLPPRGVRRESRTTAASVDRQLLARERYHRTVIDQSARARAIVPASAAATLDTRPAAPDTTPLGFEIESHNGKVTAIIFARIELGGDQPVELTFALRGSKIDPTNPIDDNRTKPLDEKVVDALTRNKLFLVANAFNAELADNLYLDSAISIAGWRFNLALPASNAPSGATSEIKPFLIVKNFAGKSIVELVADATQWCKPDLFLQLPPADNPSDPVTFNRPALKAFIDATRQNAGLANDPAAAAHRDLLDTILNNPNWQGVLLIDVRLVPADLPLQIKGLLGGIDTERLKAHYLAIPMKALASSGAKPVSRLQALVDYKTEKETPKLHGDDSGNDDEGKQDEVFGYDVERLVVVFANGQVANFYALVRFVAKRLFHLGGAYLVRRNKEGNWPEPKPEDELPDAPFTLNLQGRYTRKNEGGKIVESYTFETADDYRYVALKKKPNGKFGVDDNAIIRTVTLSRLAYETLSEDKDKGTVDSAFKIDGDIEFGKVALGSWPDLFDISAVPFTDLRISSWLKFEGETPNIKGFKFNLGAIGFDFGSATRRPGTGGFWSSFPLKFRKLWLFDGKPDLPKLGYFSFDGFGNLDCRFGFEFDLDLGSLGKFASMKSLRLGLLLGFSGGSAPGFTLGFRFPDGDGTLDIGIQGVLKLTADKYGIVDRPYKGAGGTPGNAKLIYAVNAKLDVLGYKFPPDPGMTAAIFVDPSKLGESKQTGAAVGWFAALAPKNKEVASGFDLDLIALGQRVNPIANQDPPKTTIDFVNKVKGLTTEGFQDPPPEITDPNKKKEYALDQVLKALTVDKKIDFDPSRDWSIGFNALFADRVQLAFAMRDPDLYGLYVGLFWSKPTQGAGGDKPFFSIDVLYRRLSERLGVYSTEIVLPETMRQIDFGAVTIDLPKIGLEIFTDGGFTVDLGFPWNKDFSRAFGVQILPFIGSGGFYFRKVSGPAAFLVPKKVGYNIPQNSSIQSNEAILRYDPVFEAGVGFRVGLGKEINKSMFRAGLSLTVFGTLEGAVATLKRTDKFFELQGTTPIRNTFIAVRGVVGILGEVYGYVDFGIVKAGVSIRLWVATGFDFKTDFRTKLYLEVGVSVSVVVVIARIRIFRKTIEIKISFSFATTVEFSTYLGSDRHLEYYNPPSSLETAGMGLIGAREAAWTPIVGFDWTRNLTPDHWRAASAEPLNIPVYFAPDVTFAPDGSRMRPAFVALLTAPLANARADIDEFAGLLAAWAYAAAFGLPVTGKRLRDEEVDLTRLDDLARALAVGPEGSAGGTASAADRRAHLPKVGDLIPLFSANAAITVAEAPPAKENTPPQPGVFWPMPPGSTLTIGPFGDPTSQTIAFDEKKVVDHDFRAKVDEQMQKLMALLAASSRKTKTEKVSESATVSIVESVFEEHAILVMRAAVNELTRHAQRRVEAGENGILLGTLLDDMARGAATAGEHSSTGRNILRSATRLFMHGPRLPFPALATGTANLVPPGVVDDGSSDHALYRLAWLQHPLGEAGATIAPTLTLSPGGAAPVQIEVDPESQNDLSAMTALGAAAPKLGFSTHEVERIRRVSRHFHAGRTMAIAPSADGIKSAVVMLDPDILHAMTANLGVRAADLRLRPLPADPGKNLSKEPVNQDTWLSALPAISVRLRIKPIKKSDGSGQLDMFELRGMSEADRLRLDAFEDGANRDRIGEIRLFAFDGGENPLRPLQIGAATVVQVDVSAEPKPNDAAETSAETGSVAETYVAGIDDKIGFVEIIRRTAIVNRGGTLLGWPGASGVDGFNRGRENEQFEAFLVVTITGEPETGTRDLPVNAMIVEVEDATQTLERLEAVFVNESDALTQTAEPMTEAGVLSVAVKRIDGAAPTGVDPRIWKETLERFSMFAPTLKKKDGTPLIDAGRSLAVGPTRFDDDPQDEERFRVALPVGKLLAEGDASPYAHVGDTLLFNGGWRDVYGNDWIGTAFDGPEEIAVLYSDRIIPFTDLPSLELTWWPGLSTGKANIRFQLIREWEKTLLPEPEAGQTEPSTIGAETAKALRDRLERVDAIYRRAAWQVEDRNVALSIKCDTLKGHQAWSADPTLAANAKTEITRFLKNFSTVVAGVEKAINPDMAPQAARNLISQALTAVTALTIELEAQPAAHDFVELRLAIMTERLATRAYDGASLHDEKATEDMKKALVPVPLALLAVPRDRKSAASAPRFGGDLIDLQAAVGEAFGLHRLLATGLSSKPSVGESAVWLVNRAVFPKEDCFTDGKRAIEMFALPPVSTRLHSFDEVKIAKLGTNDPLSTSFRAVDADKAAAEALGTFEDALAPDILTALLAKSGDSADLAAVRSAVQTMIAAKAGTDLDGIAHKLADRLTELKKKGAKAPDKVRDVIEDRILGSLRMAERLDALVLLTEKGSSGSEKSGPVAFGTYVPELASGVEPIPTVEFRPAVMPVGPGRPRQLVLTVDATPDAAPSEAKLKGHFQVTHVQRLDRLNSMPAGAEGRYRPTAWLKLFREDAAKAKQNELADYMIDEAKIPLVKKQYPAPPTITEELVKRGVTNFGVDIRKWGSKRTWTSEAASQDELKVTLRYNATSTGDIGSATAGDGKLQEAQWVRAFLAYQGAVSPLVRDLRGGKTTFSARELAEFMALRADELQTALARQYAQSESIKKDVLDKFTFTEKQDQKDGPRTIKVERKPDDLIKLTTAKLYQIQAGSADPKLLLDLKTDKNATISEVKNDRPLPTRVLDIDGADILTVRTVLTELQLTRNKELAGIELDDSFVYVLPIIAPGAKLAPSIFVKETKIEEPQKPIESHIDWVVEKLIGDAGLSKDDLAMTLEGLGLDIVLTFEPKLAEGVDSVDDGKHVAGLSRVDLSTSENLMRPEWLEPFKAHAAAWRAAANPRDGDYVFDIRLFETQAATGESNETDSHRLLLRIKRLVLPKTQVA